MDAGSMSRYATSPRGGPAVPGRTATMRISRRRRTGRIDVVPHGGVAPDGARLPELSHEALRAVRRPRVDDTDGWYYDQPPFDLTWVLGSNGFDPPPGEAPPLPYGGTDDGHDQDRRTAPVHAHPPWH